MEPPYVTSHDQEVEEAFQALVAVICTNCIRLDITDRDEIEDAVDRYKQRLTPTLIQCRMATAADASEQRRAETADDAAAEGKPSLQPQADRSTPMTTLLIERQQQHIENLERRLERQLWAHRAQTNAAEARAARLTKQKDEMAEMIRRQAAVARRVEAEGGAERRGPPGNGGGGDGDAGGAPPNPAAGRVDFGTRGLAPCSREGCATRTRSPHGLCYKHFNKRQRRERRRVPLPGTEPRRCVHEGCTVMTRKETGVCSNHEKRGKKCTVEGCDRWAQTGGLGGPRHVCFRHGAKRKSCSVEGCTNNAQNGGVCKRHGARVKMCTVEGCVRQVERGGYCVRHGAERGIRHYTKKGRDDATGGKGDVVTEVGNGDEEVSGGEEEAGNGDGEDVSEVENANDEEWY